MRCYKPKKHFVVKAVIIILNDLLPYPVNNQSEQLFMLEKNCIFSMYPNLQNLKASFVDIMPCYTGILQNVAIRFYIYAQRLYTKYTIEI